MEKEMTKAELRD